MHFALSSETVTASMITAELGVDPDSVLVLGSRRATPPVPVEHSWRIECAGPDLDVGEQARRVFARLRPVAEGLLRVVTAGGVRPVLQVVRYLNDDDGADEDRTPLVTAEGMVLEKLPGQHQLLGWHLAAEDLSFLASLNTAIDVDEYG